MRLVRYTSLLLLVLLIPAQFRGQTSNSQTLAPGTPIERAIGPTESHTYTINLSESQYLQFVVVQHGIDLIVRVFSPSGKSLGEFDTPNGAEGPENVSIVAVTEGSYRISVSVLDPSSPGEGGKYEIRTLELRDATEQELKVANSEGVRRTKGLALLAEVIDAIPEIRLPLTRVRVKLQSAALLRTVDEKNSARLLTEALNESKDYLATLRQDDEGHEEALQSMQQLRYEAVQTLAFTDPEAALNLFRSSRRPITTETNPGEQEQERQFELSLAGQIAARNPKRAFELAQDSLKNGYSQALPATLMRLRRSDQDLASVLAKDITTKLLGEKFPGPEAVDLALNLIRGSLPPSKTTPQNGPPLLSLPDYRALVQKLLNDGLTATSTREELQKGFTPQSLLLNLKATMGNELDSVVPGALAAIQRKLAESGTKPEPWADWKRYEDAVDSASSEAAREIIGQAPPELREALLQRVAERNIRQGSFAQAKQLVTENLTNPRQRRYALNNLERQAAYAEVSRGNIEDALKHVGRIDSLSERAQFIAEIATRIGSGQKRSQAMFLLETARSLLGTSIEAENQPQMNALLQLAGAFSRYDSKRGFEIVEPLVNQFNDLSEAARTLNGFGAQYFVNGELSLHNGNSLANVVSPLSTTFGILSLTDFDRAKTISDRLHLPEVRLTTYLAIAQQAIVPSGVYSPSAVYWNTLNR